MGRPLPAVPLPSSQLAKGRVGGGRSRVRVSASQQREGAVEHEAQCIARHGLRGVPRKKGHRRLRLRRAPNGCFLYMEDPSLAVVQLHVVGHVLAWVRGRVRWGVRCRVRADGVGGRAGRVVPMCADARIDSAERFSGTLQQNAPAGHRPSGGGVGWCTGRFSGGGGCARACVPPLTWMLLEGQVHAAA